MDLVVPLLVLKTFISYKMICGYDTHSCKKNIHVLLYSPTCYDNRHALGLIEQPQLKEVLDGVVVSLLDSLFHF